MKAQLETIKSIRKGWGDLNPVTKVIRNKTKYKRNPKHRKSDKDGEA